MKYSNGYDTFNTYEEAFEDCQQTMAWEDYQEYFENNIGFHNFFERVRKLPNFFEEFENDLFDAEVYCFEKTYFEYDDDDDDEED